MDSTVYFGMNTEILQLGSALLSFSQDVNYPDSDSSWFLSVPPCRCWDNALV
jgi:hypothetical protein